jgi:D-alanyl-D-alanine carboxypeptidase (penicillin-binding protein 5/6)
VAIYTAYAARDGSVVPVVAGEQISEYQMIEAMLLPSANNMADSLAIWAFGSLPAYAAYANQYASQLGLTQTHIGEDASGFDPSTTSTAANLVQLGEITLENPVLAHIVAQSSASGFPVVSVIKNVNSVLGTDSIIGIKTGNTAQAGGVFISASDTTVSGLAVTVITAYVGAPSLYDAMYGSLPLIVSAQDNFSPVTIAADAIVGSYRLPWGGFVQVATKSGLVIAHWKGSPITAQVRLEPIAFDSRAGSVAGALISEKSGLANSQTIPLVLTKTTTGPTDMWKLLHPEKVRWSLP